MAEIERPLTERYAGKRWTYSPSRGQMIAEDGEVDHDHNMWTCGAPDCDRVHA